MLIEIQEQKQLRDDLEINEIDLKLESLNLEYKNTGIDIFGITELKMKLDQKYIQITGPFGSIGQSSSISINENTTAVYTFEANTNVNWSLVGGADASKFKIDSSLGALTFNTAPDFDRDNSENNSYEVIVSASDSTGNTMNQIVTVTVNNIVNETKAVRQTIKIADGLTIEEAKAKKEEIRSDIADALGLPKKNVVILGIRNGSVILVYEVKINGETNAQNTKNLMESSSFKDTLKNKLNKTTGKNISVVVETPNIATVWTLDVDGDGIVRAFSDGFMILRKMFGGAFAGEALTNKAITSEATRTTQEIHDYIQEGIDSGILDVDGDGTVGAFSDGFMILRKMFGGAFAKEALTNKAISDKAARNTDQIHAYIESLMPSYQ